MTLCTHGVPTGEGYECSSCITTPDPRQDWFFTFGADHIHPDTDAKLGRSFVRIHGTCDSTRNDMFAVFGNRWSHQYSSEESAGVEQYGLTEVSMPQSFAVQLDTHLQRLEAERTPPEVEQDWFFTFGWGQHHPLTGESLANGYVVIHGTANSTRAVMVDAFGNRWSNQYRTAEDAGVERFSLRLVEVPPADVAPLFEEQVDTHLQRLAAERPAPVTPAEERTGVSDVQHAVREEVAALRVLARYYMPNPDGRNDALARLDRIEMWARGEQR